MQFENEPGMFAELYPEREVWATEMRLKAVSLVTYLAF